jgi:hypothetical protein
MLMVPRTVTFSVTENTPAVIVLSQLDTRYFSEISGYTDWSMDFVVYRKGKLHVLSGAAFFFKLLTGMTLRRRSP